MANQTTIAAALQDKIDAKAALKTIINNRFATNITTEKLSEYPSFLQSATSVWVRPADWLEIDSLVTAGEQKTVGLYAVYPNVNDYGMTNTVAFVVTGNHTIDWGDGSALENVSSNVQAEHAYNYDNISSATSCSRGYRQVRITITPQSGQNITNLQFGKKHSSVVFGRIASQWLDINISGTELTTFRFSEVNYANLLEKIKVYQSTNKCTSCASMFHSCYSLQSLNLSSFNTAAVTNMPSMFYNCYSLQSLNLSSFNTAAVTNMAYMFYNCNSLQSLNLSSFNTAAVTNMANMFSYCYSLQLIDLSATNVGAVTSVANFSNITIGITSLIKCRVPQAKWSFTVAGNPLSASELNLLFGDLATVTGQTITITGCTGAATCNKTIAINKGWTVIG